MTDHPLLDDTDDADQPPYADLAAAHRDVLATIADLHVESPPTGAAVGEACHIETDHLYHILQILEEEGLVTRDRDHHDDRVLRNAVTDAGYETLEALADQYGDIERPGKARLDNPHRQGGSGDG